MTFIQKIKTRIVDRLSGGEETEDIRKQLESLVSEDRDYALKHLPQHMAEAGRWEQFYQWLTDFDFIEAKVSHPDIEVKKNIEDYNFALNSETNLSGEQQRILKLVQGALRLSAHLLAEDTTQLVEQLLGRLGYFEIPEIQNILEVAKHRKTLPWLRPLKPNFAPPGEALLHTFAGHQNTVLAVAIAPDGQTVISASGDTIIKVWDLVSGEERFTLGSQRWFGGFSCRPTITPDSQKVILHYFEKSQNTIVETLEVWDLVARRGVLTFVTHHEYNEKKGIGIYHHQAISPDGQKLISNFVHSNITVWDLATGEEQLTFRGHYNSITGLVVTPDSQKVISSSWDGTIKVWNLASGEELLTLKGSDILMTPDGQKLIGLHDDTIKVWDLASGEELLTLKGHNIRITPDGQKLIGCHNDTIKVWDLASGEELLALRCYISYSTNLAVTPDSQKLVSASADNTLKVWDLTSGKELLTLRGHSSHITNLAVTPDSQKLISESPDNPLKVWDLTSGKELLTLRGHSSHITNLAVTPDSQKLVSASADNTLKVWDLTSGTQQKHFSDHNAPVQVLAISPDGKKAISASLDRTLKVWDLASGSEQRTLRVHLCQTQALAVVAVTPEVQNVMYASGNRLTVWDLVSGRKQHTFKRNVKDKDRHVVAVQISPDGQKVIVIDSIRKRNDYTITVWDLASGEESIVFQSIVFRDLKFLEDIAISPDGKKLIYGAFGSILKVWDLVGGCELLTLMGHSKDAQSLAVTPDGKRVIFRSLDKTLKVWDLLSGEELFTLRGHTEPISTVAVTPDGKKAISGAEDKTLKVWDLVSGEVIASFTGEGAINCCAVAPDGLTIVAGDRSGRVHFLRLENVN